MNLDRLQQEIKYKTARSGGSGGQHVNKVETKVELLFDIRASFFLTEEEKVLVMSRLEGRINKKGEVSVVCQEKRTQILNKKIAWEKFVVLIEDALKPKKKRKYKPIKANKNNRLKVKKLNSEKKEGRKKIIL